MAALEWLRKEIEQKELRYFATPSHTHAKRSGETDMALYSMKILQTC
jgi:hypothetical protein